MNNRDIDKIKHKTYNEEIIIKNTHTISTTVVMIIHRNNDKKINKLNV